MVNASELRGGMAVVAADGDPLGAVDSVAGDRVKLTRKDSTDNEHHYVPLAWVARVDERVHLNRSGSDVRASWGIGAAATTAGAAAIDESAGKLRWLPWLLLGLGLLALLFALSRCDRSGDEAAVADPAATGSAAVSGETAAAGAASATATADVASLMQVYLQSAEPAGRRFTFDTIHFATSSADLPADAGVTIDAIAAALTAAPAAKIRIEGYADARGGEGANAELGAARAASVAKAIAAAGIAADRLTTATGGESNPVDSNATAAGQAENRRTDIVVVSK